MKAVEAHKGPYFVEYGDFATAGAINFVTLDVVPENVVEIRVGSFDTQRHLALVPGGPGRAVLTVARPTRGWCRIAPSNRGRRAWGNPAHPQ